MLLPLRKHIQLPSTLGLPKALRHESGHVITGLGLYFLPHRVQGMPAFRRHLGAPRHYTFWGHHLILLQSLCAKLKQCVVLACFVLYKIPLPPLPLCFKRLYKFLNSELEILFTLISLFSQKSI